MAQSFKEKTLARKFAFKFLYHKNTDDYHTDISSDDLEVEMDEFEESYLAPDEEHLDNELGHEAKIFGRRLVLDAFKNATSTLEQLRPMLEPRSIDKLDRLERTLIVLGATEMLTRKDTPAAVVINEFVELAKEYGNQKSYTFVNGVLDKLSKGLS